MWRVDLGCYSVMFFQRSCRYQPAEKHISRIYICIQIVGNCSGMRIFNINTVLSDRKAIIVTNRRESSEFRSRGTYQYGRDSGNRGRMNGSKLPVRRGCSPLKTIGWDFSRKAGHVDSRMEWKGSVDDDATNVTLLQCLLPSRYRSFMFGYRSFQRELGTSHYSAIFVNEVTRDSINGTLTFRNSDFPTAN